LENGADANGRRCGALSLIASPVTAVELAAGREDFELN
jgi:hypothetical protein